MRIDTRTSSWNKTVFDPYVNMLRGTVEAMAAAIGGSESLNVLPFDSSYSRPGCIFPQDGKEYTAHTQT